MKTKQPGSEIKKIPVWLIAVTVVLQLALASGLSLLLVSRGPFSTIRRNLIATAMSTYRHQYIADMLFTQRQIDDVMNAGQAVQAATQDLSEITPQYYNNTDIKEEQITSKDGKFAGYLLEISDPSRLAVTYTQFLGKRGENTSDMARRMNAVAAVNGGGFSDASWAGTGSKPSDFLIIGGELVWADDAYQGDPVNTIALNAEGKLVVGEYTLKQLQNLQPKIMYAVTLRDYPPLISGGKGTFKNASQSDYKGVASRTAIGQKADGTIILLVLDGRRQTMKGATLYDLQTIMLDHGAVTAANLDGGNSSTMYYDGDVINNPSGEYGERTVATCFYVTQ